MSDPCPSFGMRVIRKTVHKNGKIPNGMGGVIDVIGTDGVSFWVATDCGGWCGWTTFDDWNPE